MALHASRFGLAEQKRNVWSVTVPAETSYESTLDPGFWAHVAAKLRIGDIIQVRDETFTFFAELIVRDCGHLFAVVDEISHKAFGVPDGVAADNTGGLTVGWGGRFHRFRVMRLRDGKKEVLAHGFDTQEQAMEARTELASRMNLKAA